MTDLMGVLNQAGNVVDDYTDSDDSPQMTPKNDLSTVEVSHMEEEVVDDVDNTIDSISIVITDISGNNDD